MTDIVATQVAPRTDAGTEIAVRGGEIVPAPILVNTDGETIEGDGSLENPLRAVGGGGGLFPVQAVITLGHAATGQLAANETSPFDLTNGGAQKVQLPAASSVPNGTQAKFVYENGQDGSSLQIIGTGGDTVRGVLTTINFSGGSGAYGSDTYTSDGVSTWWESF